MSQTPHLSLPDEIANKPELELGLELYFEAFFDLSTCRPLGMSEGPIPYMDIVGYFATMSMMDEEGRYKATSIIRNMDAAYLKKRGEVADKQSKAKKPMKAG